MSSLACSVVIPSHNRVAMLEAVLDALAAQSAPLSSFEVFVVLDGSDDGSDAILTRWAAEGPLLLRWTGQEGTGQAAARNRGVAMTRAPVVLFLDDDVVPEPDLIVRHLRHHVRGDRVAVLGDCPVERNGSPSMYELGVWAWWEDTNFHRAMANHRSSYRDFCAGNVSLRRDDFLGVGGFDKAFRGYGAEDYELGYRLLRSGVRFIVDREARAVHRHRATLGRVLRAAREEGAADVLLGRLHPELRAGLRLMWPEDLREYRPARLAFLRPRAGALAAASLRRTLRIHEAIRRRGRWLRVFDFLRAHAYWRGVADALGSRAALEAYRAGVSAPPVWVLDITDGLPDPLPALWMEGPNRIVVTAFGRHLGEVVLERAPEEPVRARLAEQISRQLRLDLMALLADGPGLHRRWTMGVGATVTEPPSAGVGA